MSNSESFQKQLAFGAIAESVIGKWLCKKGRAVLPVYDIEYQTGKGPRLFFKDRKLIAPDILAFHDGKITWIEAKHKTRFSWYSIDRRWVTGIDLQHYEHYLEVSRSIPLPVWLLFLHEIGQTWDKDLQYGAPASCPTGLFGNSLDVLEKSVNHTSKKHGRTGMVYWAHSSLKLLARIEDLPS